MSLVRDIGELMEMHHIGVVGESIYCGDMPEGPDDIVGVFEYAGRKPMTLASLDSPGLQIRARGHDYETVRGVMQKAQNLLMRIGDGDDMEYSSGVTLNGTQYFVASPIQGAFPLGRDKSGRIEFAQNYYITLRR